MVDPKNEIKYLTEEQVRKIIDKIGKRKTMRRLRDRALLEVLFSTGLRVAECMELTREQLSTESAGETLELAIVGKGGHQRTVYVSPQALGAIKAYLAIRKDADLRLFPMTVRGAQYIVKRRGEEAGFKGVRCHLLRHSFATNLLKKGVDLVHVQGFMGHKQLGTTQRYLHVANGALKEIHKKLYL